MAFWVGSAAAAVGVVSAVFWLWSAVTRAPNLEAIASFTPDETGVAPANRWIAKVGLLNAIAAGTAGLSVALSAWYNWLTLTP